MAGHRFIAQSLVVDLGGQNKSSLSVTERQLRRAGLVGSPGVFRCSSMTRPRSLPPVFLSMAFICPTAFSAWPLDCGWCWLDFSGLMPQLPHHSTNFDQNWGPSSGYILSGTPKVSNSLSNLFVTAFVSKHCKSFHCKNCRFPLCSISHCSFTVLFKVNQCMQWITVIKLDGNSNLSILQSKNCNLYN